MSTRITIDNLAKTYRTRQEGTTHAVDGVSLQIEPGELFFLLGPSGCGKTTLLRMIAGFIEPTSGSIAFDGQNVTHTPANKRDTGMVFQSYALWPHMSVAQNVGFGLDVRGVPKEEKSARIVEALRAVQMDHLMDRKPTQLSGGQQQRIALARALVVRPRVLLLDEPLSNLDAKLRIELRTEIRRICKEFGMTTVYVTHDQKEALSMADRIAILRAGKTMQVGTPLELYRSPKTPFVASFLGETNLLKATVKKLTDSSIVLDAGFGMIESSYKTTSTELEEGDAVTLSIRPETIELIRVPTDQHIPGKIAQSVYLGDHAQYSIALSDGTEVEVTEFNPQSLTQLEIGSEVGLQLNPADVCVLLNQLEK